MVLWERLAREGALGGTIMEVLRLDRVQGPRNQAVVREGTKVINWAIGSSAR